MTPRSRRCSVRSRLPGGGRTLAASSISTSGSTPLHRSSCVCAGRGRRAAGWRDCAGCASDSSGQGSGSPAGAGPRPGPGQGRGRWAELEEFVPHVQPGPGQESYLGLFEELGRLHAGLRATWEPDLPQPLDDHRTSRQLHYWLGFTRRRLGPGAGPWCAAPAPSSRAGQSPARRRAAARSGPRRLQARRRGPAAGWLLVESRPGFRARPGAALRRGRQPVLGI